MMRQIFFLASLCGLTLAASKQEDPLVSTKVGLIKGLRDENGYAKFLGVPYGKVGSNVFGVAEPYPEFEDIFEAYNDSTMCMQMRADIGYPIGTTDCLTLNIYVPDNANSGNRLPVMVWIHGGAFIVGTATAEAGNPHTLLKHDVIVVAINYRLGVFGFMCLNIPEVPGNTGLKDQTLALRWINENIEAFGGDANQITIFGESAGGMSTNLHLFSLNERLFSKTIIQSGTAFSYFMMVESDTTIPFRLTEYLGFNATDIYEALSFLNQADPQAITQAAFDLLMTTVTDSNQPLTKPCVEQVFEGIEQFLTEHPMNMKSSKASTTSVMIGNNDNEFALDFYGVSPDYFDSYDFDRLFALGFNMENELVEGITDVMHFYLGDENISAKVSEQVTDFGTDFIFNHPTQRMVQKLLESGGTNVYNYIFSYDGSLWINKTWSGAAHTEELLYLFDLGQGDKTAADQITIDRMAEIWTNFAKYGNPTPTTSELVPVKWTPVTSTTRPYLDIGSDLTLKNRPFHERMAFWDLFYKYYGHYQKWYKA